MEFKNDYIDKSEDTTIVKEDNGVTNVQIINNAKHQIASVIYYDVLPGIIIGYNNFNVEKIKSNYCPEGEVFAIDHCSEGRIEQEVSPGVFRYVGTNDIRLDNRRNHATNFFFPLAHYYGISVMFEIDKADESIRKIFPDFPISVVDIRNRFCKDDNCSYLRNEDTINRIFQDLYNIPTSVKKHYQIIKVIELLLNLWSLGETNTSEPITYYGKTQVDKVKDICKVITSDYQKHYTVQTLAKEYQISPTSLKNTFKGIYGKPIYTYLLEKRMEHAAGLIEYGEKSITEIACEVGYETPSKFTAAFKKIMNVTPHDYKISIKEKRLNN